jgi:heptosyltransferase I
VQHIQRHWPETKITWVIGKVEAALLQGLTNVEFVIFDKKAGLRGYLDLRANLRQQHFDVLLHMQVALRASLASLCIRARVKIGFDRQRAIEGQWLFTNKKIAPQQAPHVLDGFMGFAEALGLTPGKAQWSMPLSEQDESWAQTQAPKQQALAIICPAASKAERNWHSQGYAQAAQHLAAKGFCVMICGGPTAMELQLAEEITALSQVSVTNMVGKTSLKQLLALLKRAHLVIAPDTGPAHMAVTVGTPVVGLYAHSNPQRTGPYLYRQHVVSCYPQALQQQYAKTVAQLPWGTRAKGDGLMQHIKINQVTDAIDSLINKHYPAQFAALS